VDQFCEEQRVDRLDLIKIDIEGCELRALRGAIRTLKRFQPVILIELNGSALERDGYSVRDLIIFLEELRYTICRISPRAMVTRTAIPGRSEIVNVMCKIASSGSDKVNR